MKREINQEGGERFVIYTNGLGKQRRVPENVALSESQKRLSLFFTAKSQ